MRETQQWLSGALPVTKFALPAQQAAIIPRPRLIEALDAGSRRPLTLLAAPPGAGKTVLLGRWIAEGEPPGPVAWVSLDSADADRRRFWHAVLEAMGRAGVCDEVAEVARHAGHRAPRMVDALASFLAERDTPVVLVLDDFHEVGGRVNADLDRLLRHPPPGLRIVVATRADPPLHLGRLRLQDQLTEIRAPDLAFTLAETVAMLAEFRVQVGEAHLRRLWVHTEGWVAALRLIALSLHDHSEPERFVDEFAGDDRAVSDYLVSEILANFSTDDRWFLLRTSIVDVLNGDLADALTDRTDGHRRLTALAQGGALLAAVDRRGEWYRYHALFAELLRAEMHSERGDQAADLHRRAAGWLAEHGDDVRALRHAVDGEAWDLAARLAGERWTDLMIRGEIGVLHPLIERLPEERTVADPELALAAACARLDRGDEGEAARLLNTAAVGAERVPPERRARFIVSLSALELYVARLRGDLSSAAASGRELAASGLLAAGKVEPSLRSLALSNLGIAELWGGELDAAEAHLTSARGAAAEAGHEWLGLIAVAHLALLAGTRHDYARSARLARDAIELAEARGWEGTWPAGAAYLALATAEFLGDRVEDAALALEAAHEALATAPERPLRAGLALLRAGMLRAHGELEMALAVLTAAVDELGDRPLVPAIREHYAVREAALRAELGEYDHAVSLLRGDDGEGPSSLPAATLLGQLLLGRGEPAEARATIAKWMPQLKSERSPASVQGWLVDSLAREAQADHGGAAASLERALERAEPSGLRWAFLTFGRSLRPLLQERLRRGTEHRALVGELLQALDHVDGRARPHAELVIEPLSPRERAVLRFLPTMMSNQEIAAELFVSVNTVKTHLKAIYRKLDVMDRREAVRRARMLELLAP
jgi:LuxR family transcriptional regulator, maltose regulon positive regulatory protein